MDRDTTLLFCRAGERSRAHKRRVYPSKVLAYRNQLNHTMMAEGELLFDNVWTVEHAGIPSVPNLQLVSTEQPEVWITHHIEFAEQSGGQLELFDAGHYMHQDEPERIAALSREFIMSISD